MNEPFDLRWSEIYVCVENRTDVGFDATVRIVGCDFVSVRDSFAAAWARCEIPKELEPDWAAVEKMTACLPTYISWWAESSAHVTVWDCSLSDERTGKNFIASAAHGTLHHALADAVRQFRLQPR